MDESSLVHPLGHEGCIYMVDESKTSIDTVESPLVSQE